MKKVRTMLVFLIMLCSSVTLNVAAAEDVPTNSSTGRQESRDVFLGDPKGSVISTAIADITNEGGGDIGILIETLAHVPCEEISHTAYLERWDEEHQDWAQVAYYEFEEHQEDHPGGKLTALTSTVTVTDQPSGYYYRVRGFHSVTAGDIVQGFTTRTDGVLITAKP